MAKRLLVTLVAFVTVFFMQAQVWAAANQAEKAVQTESYTVGPSVFYGEDAQAPYQVAGRKMGSGGTDSMIWLTSILIPGLGQFLMGDLWRGLKFFLIIVGIQVVTAILTTVIGVTAINNPGNILAGAGMASLLALIGGLAALGVHIWNIIDAYGMSQEMGGVSKLEAEEIAKLNNEMKEFIAMAQKVNVSGGNVSVKALAF